ncbi:MAG: SIS domain-containing protein [bacterium]
MNKKSNTNYLIEGYYDRLDDLFRGFLNNQTNRDAMNEAINMLKKTKDTDRISYIVGNGGSAALAEHMAIDLTKNAGLKALAISGSPMLTTFSNDYGYEHVFSKAIGAFGKKDDILIAISSGGTSPNIINACISARNKGMKIITLSGFNSDNPLRKQGIINFWIDTNAYGFVEIIHGLILHYINDSIIGSEVYMIK